MDTAIIDANSAIPDAASMLAAPLVTTSINNFGGELSPSRVTKVAKLLASMKMKNMREEIRTDATMYLGFLKTL